MKEKCEISLLDVKPGQKVRLMSIEVGKSLRSRLAAMGMVANTEIMVISDGRPGPFVVNVKGTKIALGRDMVSRIMVEDIGD